MINPGRSAGDSTLCFPGGFYYDGSVMVEPPSSPHVLLVPMGTPGDLQPFIDLGGELRGRGHRVSLLAHANFAPWATRAGLEFAALGSADEYERFLGDKNLWSLMKATRVFARRLVCPAIKPIYEFIERLHRQGPLVVVAQTMALGARIARDKLAFRLITLHRQPAVLRSVHASPRIPIAWLPDRMPRWLKRAQYRGIDWALDHTYLPAINGQRELLGLPPVKRFADQWLQSPDGAICFWPEWFAPPQPDWPTGTRLVGFNLQCRAECDVDEELRNFIEGGDPPVAFTIGSGMREQGSAFYIKAIEICRLIACRGVLVTKSLDGLSGGAATLPDFIHHARYAPFRWLLPRCAAVVHHAGIGTVGEALAAGLPQLSMSGLVFDTMDTARRMEMLGVGRTVPQKRFTVARAGATLKEMLDDSAMRMRCRTISARVNEDAISHAADVVTSGMLPAAS